MNSVKLIYFKGCPNYETARNLLLQLGYHFKEIDQGDLPENHSFRNYTSPTIIKNKKLICGEKMDSFQGGCTLQLPCNAELKRKLEAC
jgi:hypothetical protein